MVATMGSVWWVSVGKIPLHCFEVVDIYFSLGESKRKDDFCRLAQTIASILHSVV